MLAGSASNHRAVNDFLTSFREYGMSSQAEVAIVFDSDEAREKFFSNIRDPKFSGLKDLKFDLQSNAADDDDLFFFLSDDKPADEKQAETKVETESKKVEPAPVYFEDEVESKPESKPAVEKKVESKPKEESDAFFMFSGDDSEEKKSEPVVEKKVEQKVKPADQTDSDDNFFLFDDEPKKSRAEQIHFLSEPISPESKDGDSFFFYPALDQSPPPVKKSFVTALIDGGEVKIRSLVMPREMQNVSNGHGTSRARCCYALDQLKNDYDYIIFCEPNVVITRNVNLHAICDEFFEQKNLWGNETTGTDFKVDWIKMSCAKWFSSTLDWQKVLSPLYLWFNQPQIYRTSDLDEFFEVTEVLDNITALAWTDFLHYIYMYYLILYHGFKIRDIGLKSIVGVGEANRIENLEDKSPEFKPMLCKKTIARDLENDNLFMVFG